MCVCVCVCVCMRNIYIYIYDIENKGNAVFGETNRSLWRWWQW
jgi:hypothetical protein